MYIWGVFTMIHFEAKKYGLKGLPKEEVPSIKKLLKEQWFMMLPLLVITWMMVQQFSAGNAAFWGIVTCLIISLANRGIKQGNILSGLVLFIIPIKMVLDLVIYLITLTGPLNIYVKIVYDSHPGYYIILPVLFLVFITFLIHTVTNKRVWEIIKSIGHEIWNATTLGSKQTLVIGATVGAIGVIIGSVELTGLASRFSNILLGFAGDNILLNVIMVALASLILGMGVPVTAAYMITIILVAPVFDHLGVSLIAAHMIVYWFSQDSNITPPVCIAAYAGAAIAGSDPWKTGWTSFKFAKMLYVMPILFAYVPAILLDGSMYEILVAFVSCILGTIAFSSLTMLYFVDKTKWHEWIIMLPTTILLFWPTIITTVIGIGLLVLVYFMQKARVRKAVA
jgi:TRAP transporter 4TM/12TM fusion protein